MRALVSLLGFALALALAACFDPGAGNSTSDTGSGSTTDDTPCVPGELRPCVCPSGAGNQECNAQGSAFGPCQCLGGSGETGPASTGPDDTTGAPASTGPASTGPGDTTLNVESTGPGESTDEGTTIGVAETGPVGSSTGTPGPLFVGEECNSDADCMTGVCWDFSDYDPLCFGTACSVHCMSDADCFNAMAMAGAPNPAASGCGFDGRCSTLGTGFGAYACAAEPG